MRVDFHMPGAPFGSHKASPIKKYRAWDKLEIVDYCGRKYLAYNTIKSLVRWRKSRSARPVNRAAILQDLHALLEGLLAIDEKGNVTVPQPLPPARSQSTLAAIEKQLLKATPVVRAVLKGNNVPRL